MVHQHVNAHLIYFSMLASSHLRTRMLQPSPLCSCFAHRHYQGEPSMKAVIFKDYHVFIGGVMLEVAIRFHAILPISTRHLPPYSDFHNVLDWNRFICGVCHTLCLYICDLIDWWMWIRRGSSLDGHARIMRGLRQFCMIMKRIAGDCCHLALSFGYWTHGVITYLERLSLIWRQTSVWCHCKRLISKLDKHRLRSTVTEARLLHLGIRLF